MSGTLISLGSLLVVAVLLEITRALTDASSHGVRVLGKVFLWIIGLAIIAATVWACAVSDGPAVSVEDTYRGPS